MMIALRYVQPEHLVSGNEYSGYVDVKHDYDYHGYRRVMWRITLADLDGLAAAACT